MGISVELKLNQSVLAKMAEVKASASSPARKTLAASSSAAATRAKDRAAAAVSTIACTVALWRVLSFSVTVSPCVVCSYQNATLCASQMQADAPSATGGVQHHVLTKMDERARRFS